MNFFEIIGAVIGLFYIVSEYKADRWFWPLSLLMSAFYAVIDFTSGIYANGVICVYNFVMSIYGILVWRGILWSKSQQVDKSTSQRVISSCPRAYWWQIVTVTVLLSGVLTWQLGYLNQSTYTLPSGRTLNLSLLDGISSALTIVGMLMLAHKWWQQWFCWMLVEPLMIVIFILTGNYASAVLYAVFEVFCILGILRWRKESQKDLKDLKDPKDPKVVILAAGDFPTHPVPLAALREADFVVCCDSAYCAIRNKKLGIRNYVVIGDGDSLSEADKKALGDRWIHVAEQDYNDLHKAMDYATSQFTIHKSQFTILGATGKREDHTLGNISYLVTFGEEYPGADIEMLTDYGRFRAVPPTLNSQLSTLNSYPGQQVSIFSMDPELPIYGEGLRWPLDGLRARRWWQATLNEALGDSVVLRSEGWLVVFLNY